jgi:hypothetical protein
MITLSGRSLEISISFIFLKKIYSDDHIIWKEPENLKIKKISISYFDRIICE